MDEETKRGWEKERASDVKNLMRNSGALCELWYRHAWKHCSQVVLGLVVDTEYLMVANIA